MKQFIFFIGILLAAFITVAQPCVSIVAPQLSENTRKDFEQKLSVAKTEYEKDTLNADAIIWYGRRTAYLGGDMKAIDIFSRGISIHPGDARLYRHRGHRYITVRCFDKAIADFKKAAALIKDKPDEVEPDGLPNAKNIPTSTLQSNIWYHLGLAYFLKGEYEKAESAYFNGLAVSKNDDMYVAMANWLHITLLMQVKLEQADSVFNTISRTPQLIENTDYNTVLYFYVHRPAVNEIDRYTNAVLMRTVKEQDTMSVSAATIYFGAGYYAWLRGMPEKANLFLEKAIATNQWSSFGYIAAETYLKKWKK